MISIKYTFNMLLKLHTEQGLSQICFKHLTAKKKRHHFPVSHQIINVANNKYRSLINLNLFCSMVNLNLNRCFNLALSYKAVKSVLWGFRTLVNNLICELFCFWRVFTFAICIEYMFCVNIFKLIGFEISIVSISLYFSSESITWILF